jgi:hypothetical protein
VLDELALHFDRANGTLAFASYGYGLLWTVAINQRTM